MIPRPPESEMRAQAAALKNALMEFESARQTKALSQRELKDELGDTAEELRDLLTRAKKLLNGTGKFKTQKASD